MLTSFDAQIGLDQKGKPACVLLMLDGLVNALPPRDAVCSGSLSNSTLTLNINGQTLSLSGLSQEISDLLQKGSPLVVKHSASGYEAIATVE